MTAPARLVELAHACCAGQATAPRELEPILNTELLRGAELHPVACSAGQFCWGACGLRSATQARARPWGPGRHEGGCQLSAGGRDRRLWPRVCLQEQCLGPGRIPSVQARGRPRTRGARAFASCPLPDPGATQCMQCAVMAHEQPDCDALYCASRAVLACFMYRLHPPQHPTTPTNAARATRPKRPHAKHLTLLSATVHARLARCRVHAGKLSLLRRMRPRADAVAHEPTA